MIIIKHRKSADVVLLRVDAVQLDDRDLTGAYLLGAGMAGLSARRALLREANLRNADLRAANLAGADLSGAVLRNADLRDVDLSSAVLLDADLRGADLSRANLCGANLSRAQLSEVVLTGVRCDAQTVWPLGEAWGLMVQPVAPVEMSVRSRELAAGRAAIQSWTLAQQRSNLSERRGVSRHGWMAGFGVAALAVALLAAVLPDRNADQGSRTARRPEPTARLTERAPISTPEAPALKPAREQRPDLAPATGPNIAQQPPPTLQLPPPVQIRTAPARVARGRSARPSRLARQAVPIWPSSELRPSSVGGKARTRAAHRLVVLTSAPARNRRSATLAPTTVVETSMPKESPAVEPVVAATPVAAAPVSPPLARPSSLPEPRQRKMAEAFGNREFHYGSGYDIYTMHLGRQSE